MKKISRRFERSPHRQQGLTAITIAVILVLIGFFAMLVIRLFPIYMEHFSVASHLKDLGQEGSMASKTDAEILSTLDKRFTIDDVKNVKRENIFIEREKGGPVTVAIEYEVRTPALANVDMVVSFSDEVELK